MTDGSFAEEGCPAAGCKHRCRAIGGLHRLCRNRPGVTAAPKYGLPRHKDVQQSFLPRVRPSARLDSVDRLTRRRHEIDARRLLRKRLAKLHEEGADQWSGSAADLHDQRHSNRLQHLRQRFVRQAGQCGEHGLETPLHIQPVIAVADCLVQAGQFFGVFDHRRCKCPHQSFPGYPIETHAATLPPSASKNSGLLRRSETISPAPSLASGSDSVTTDWPPRSRWRWLWSPRCSIRVTVADTSPPPRAMVRFSVRAPIVLAPIGAPAKRAAGSRLIAGWPSRAATWALIGFSYISRGPPICSSRPPSM